MNLALMRLDDASVVWRQTPSQAPAFCGASATRGHSIPGAASAGELISRTVRQKPERRERVQHPRHDLPLGASESRTDTRGHPNTGRCHQTMYVTTFVISDNNACPPGNRPRSRRPGSFIV